MDGDTCIEDDERSIELSSIAAIFPELQIDPKNPFAATLELTVSPSEPLAVVFPVPTSTEDTNLVTALEGLAIDDHAIQELESDAQATATIADIRQLSHLPALRIRFELPEGYPEDVPPKIRLSAEPSWIPEAKLQDLGNRAAVLWEELGHCQIVYDYIDLLQQAADVVFDLRPKNGLPLVLPPVLEVALLDYDLKIKRQKFEESTFTCGVCLEPKKGISCYQLQSCGHVFCIECLQSFYNNCITEGDVYSVKCLAPDCERKTTGHTGQKDTLDASELIQLHLGQEQVDRYIKLLRKKQLESNKDTIYCPRKWCQGPAKSTGKAVCDPSTAPANLPPPADRLAICLDCSFAFCHICQQSWHGTHTPCHPRSSHELSAEETATEKYLLLHSQLCPTCRARCQKTQGCNHMECFQCKTHFCYLCRAFLNRDNPYKHYNAPFTNCYLKLWVMEEGDGEPGTLQDGWALEVPGPHHAENEDDGHGDNGDNGEVDDDDDDDDVAVIPPPAPVPPQQQQQQNNRAARGAANRARPVANAGQAAVGNGLQRFLAMAAADQEDEWDSDDLDDLWPGL